MQIKRPWQRRIEPQIMQRPAIVISYFHPRKRRPEEPVGHPGDRQRRRQSVLKIQALHLSRAQRKQRTERDGSVKKQDTLPTVLEFPMTRQCNAMQCNHTCGWRPCVRPCRRPVTTATGPHRSVRTRSRLARTHGGWEVRRPRRCAHTCGTVCDLHCYHVERRVSSEPYCHAACV